MTSPSWHRVGTILRAHGIKGEVFIASDIFPVHAASELLLQSSSGQTQGPVAVEECRPHKKGWIVRFKGISTLTQADTLRGYDVLTSDALPENVYWSSDLLGCTVVTTEGEQLGVLKEIIGTAANDLFLVSDGKKEFYLPALKNVVREMDFAGRKITISLLPGLRETFD